MVAKIAKNLNLVIPVPQEDGSKIHVHAAPVSTQVFEDNAMLFAKTFARIMGEGLGINSAPRVARRIFEEVADEMQPPNETKTADSAKSAVIAEMTRLTNVIVPTVKGYETMMLQDAIDLGHLDAVDASEVNNALAFFTLNWHMHRKNIRSVVMHGAAQLWGGQMSSLNVTEFANSLKTSTKEENTGEKRTPALSVPS